MKDQKKFHLFFIVLSCFVLFSGSIVALILSAENVSVATDFVLFRGVVTAALTGLLIVLIIETISVFRISDSTYHTTLFAAAVFLTYCFSPDVCKCLLTFDIVVPEKVMELVGYFAFTTAIFFDVLFFYYTYRPAIEPQFKKLLKTSLFTILPLAYFLYVGLSFVGLQIVAHLIIFLFSLLLLTICAKGVIQQKKTDSTFYAGLLLACALLGMESVTVLSYSKLIRPELVGFPLGHALLIIFLFGYVYTAFIVRSDRKIRLSNEYKLQTEQLKATILTQQMKPHFVFNSLATIKAIYHKNLEEGDNALDLFSKQLRSDIEAIDKELIPLEDELEYVANYVEFENIKRETAPIDVIFNIDFADFYVPALSLQPLVENAVKHGQLDKREDGNIMIATFLEGEDAVIEITDNGVGFDASTVRKGSCGINNTRARFEMLLDAKMEIKSEINVGTTITVRINHPRLTNENYHS